MLQRISCRRAQVASGLRPLGELAPYLQDNEGYEDVTFICQALTEYFGFLLLRHGDGAGLGYPEVSHAPRVSFEGLLELIAFPAGLLIILGLYTRPVSLVLAVLSSSCSFLGPSRSGLTPIAMAAIPSC